MATTNIVPINLGAAPNDGTGDPARTAYGKTNDNDAALLSGLAVPYATPAQVQEFVEAYSDLAASGRRDLTAGMTDNGDGTISVAERTYLLYAGNDYTADKTYVVVPAAAALSVATNSASYILARYNAGTPVYAVASISTPLAIDEEIVGYATRGEDLEILLWDRGPISAETQLLERRLLFVEGLSLTPDSGTLGSSGNNLRFQISPLTVYLVVDSQTVPGFDSETATFDQWSGNSTAGWSSTAENDVDNTRYVDGAGVLQTLGNGRYGTRWVYVTLSNVSAEVSVVIGLSNAKDYSEAADESALSPDKLPGSLQGPTTILLGRIIVKKNETSFESIENVGRSTGISTGQVSPTDLNEASQALLLLDATTLGSYQAWASAQTVSIGDRRTSDTPLRIYVAASAGTTGVTPPTGTGTGISDGGVTWDYLRDTFFDELNDNSPGGSGLATAGTVDLEALAEVWLHVVATENPDHGGKVRIKLPANPDNLRRFVGVERSATCTADVEFYGFNADGQGEITLSTQDRYVVAIWSTVEQTWKRTMDGVQTTQGWIDRLKLGTAAFLDAGVSIGDVVQLEDLGGAAALPAVDGSRLTGLPGDSGTPDTTRGYDGAGDAVDRDAPSQRSWLNVADNAQPQSPWQQNVQGAGFSISGVAHEEIEEPNTLHVFVQSDAERSFAATNGLGCLFQIGDTTPPGVYYARSKSTGPVEISGSTNCTLNGVTEPLVTIRPASAGGAEDGGTAVLWIQRNAGNAPVGIVWGDIKGPVDLLELYRASAQVQPIDHDVSGPVTLDYDLGVYVTIAQAAGANITGWTLANWPSSVRSAMKVNVVRAGTGTIVQPTGFDGPRDALWPGLALVDAKRFKFLLESEDAGSSGDIDWSERA